MRWTETNAFSEEKALKGCACCVATCRLLIRQSTYGKCHATSIQDYRIPTAFFDFAFAISSIRSSCRLVAVAGSS